MQMILQQQGWPLDETIMSRMARQIHWRRLCNRHRNFLWHVQQSLKVGKMIQSNIYIYNYAYSRYHQIAI